MAEKTSTDDDKVKPDNSGTLQIHTGNTGVKTMNIETGESGVIVKDITGTPDERKNIDIQPGELVYTFGKGKLETRKKRNFKKDMKEFVTEDGEKVQFMDLPTGKYSFSGKSMDKVNVIKTDYIENMTIYTGRTGPTMLLYSKCEKPQAMGIKRKADQETREKDMRRAKKHCKCGPVYYVGVDPDDLLLPDREKDYKYYEKKALYGEQEHAIWCRCFVNGRREMEWNCYPVPFFGSDDDEDSAENRSTDSESSVGSEDDSDDNKKSTSDDDDSTNEEDDPDYKPNVTRIRKETEAQKKLKEEEEEKRKNAEFYYVSYRRSRKRSEDL